VNAPMRPPRLAEPVWDRSVVAESQSCSPSRDDVNRFCQSFLLNRFRELLLVAWVHALHLPVQHSIDIE
jgi:hypothetical protein